MSAELERHFQVSPILTPGGGGVFDVALDNELVFTRKQCGRFPRDGEVVALIQQRKQ